jgi:hypothetical protein
VLPASPVVGPTHAPELLMTVFPLMLTLVGVMSPFTFPATIAYGTLRIACRGVISGSPPTATPRYSGSPVKIVGGIGTGVGVPSPRMAEKYPSSTVISWLSVQSAVPPTGAA